MAKRRYSPRGRLLITGGILLLLLVAGIVAAGRFINRTAASMSERIVAQIGETHYALLDFEFRKAGRLFGIAGNYIRRHPSATEAELQVLASTLMESDPKMGRFWYSSDGGRTLCDFCRDEPLRRHPASGPDDFRSLTLRKLTADTLSNRIVRDGEQVLWSMARRIDCPDGSTRVCGIDLPLSRIYDHMTVQNPYSRSYAAVYDPEGTVVYHPSPSRLGQRIASREELATLRKVIATGRQAVAHPVSDYLGVEEERIYFPLPTEGATWVAMVAVPRLAIEQEIEDFHRYTLLIAVLSTVLFGLLLILAQRRWRREYELRRQSERESAQLHLQRVLDRIDPHFLFNSLNSLYALIPNDPDLAREFTLTLARVYRHVLEHSNEMLVTVEDELALAREYFSLQKIRFRDRIHLTTEVDADLRRCMIPSMSLQTLVENALKHNSITEQNPLRIRIFTHDGKLVIENNYTPRTEHDAASLGVGLDRIRSVYRFYTAENIEIRMAEGHFRCSLPLLPCKK